MKREKIEKNGALELPSNGKKKRGKRDWVKNAIIIFLAILLVLTFFSNTIMNYSLPEVAAQYPMSTTITSKIRGSGTVETAQSYNVTVQETRTVASVAVKKGDTIAAGDTLMTLDETESEELTTARETLASLQLEYDKMLVDKADEGAAASASSISQAQAAVSRAQSDLATAQKNASNLKSYQNAVASANNSLTAATNAKSNVETKVANIQSQISSAGNDDAEYQAALYDAEQKKAIYDSLRGDGEDSILSADEATINQAYEDWKAAQEYATQVYASNVAPVIASLNEQLAAAQQEVSDAEVSVNNATAAVSAAQTALESFQNSMTGPSDVSAAEDALQSAKDNLATLQAAATDTANTNSYNDAINQLELKAKEEALAEAQEKVDKLEEKTSATNIVSRYAGVVTEVNVAAGDSTTADTPLLVVELTEKGYTLKATVTKDQAKLLKEGLEAEITNLWDSGITMTLTSITADKSNPSESRQLTFSVVGEDVTVGQSLSFSIGDKNASYDLVIPSSAIHTDSSGSFVYTVAVKSSPLGNRYTVKKTTVTVLASDDTNSAVSGDLTSADFVITTSTVPLDVGSQVRIAE